MYTLQKKLDQHTTHITCSVPVWSQTIRISRGQRIAIFHIVINRFEQIHCPQEEGLLNRFEQIHCPQEEGLLTQLPAWRLTGPQVRTQHLSYNNQWGSGKNTSFCWQPANRLTGLISPHVIDTFNTCSRGPTYQSLIDTDRDYNWRTVEGDQRGVNESQSKFLSGT
jgi:hypothetical protein